jgi:hypothetical protein
MAIKEFVFIQMVQNRVAAAAVIENDIFSARLPNE